MLQKSIFALLNYINNMAYKKVTLSSGKDQSLRRFHPLVFSGAIKKMKEEIVDIKIVFKQTCHILFKEAGCPEIGNVLTIRIQPDEGISMRVIAKTPGSKLALDSVTMNFSYEQTFGSEGMDAYEKVLVDILAGDKMLFNRSDELDSSWNLI